MSDSLYNQFTNYIRTNVSNGTLQNFKSDPNVTYMLEHVTQQSGYQYYEYIKKHTLLTTEQITSYCKKNDMYGGGKKYDFGWIVTSPSNFRYLLQSHIILTHMKRLGLKDVCVAEIGGGYGGLCLAMSELAPLYDIVLIEYNLIDLPDISSLQQWYLSNFTCSTKTLFHSAYTYGSNISSSDLFLISNYSFSEIDMEHQTKYITHLFPKVAHGFITWNHISVYDCGFKVTIEDEYPLTSNNSNPLLNNKYVYF